MDEALNTRVGLPAVLRGQDLTLVQEDVKRDLPEYWERDFINERINQIKNPGHRMFFITLWYTGMRVSEASGPEGFQRKDLDFQNYTLTLRWLKNRKWNKRIIPIRPELRDMLQIYTASMKAEDRVFPFGRVRAFQLSRKYFGPDAHPHKFRHSFGVNWKRGGGRTSDLQRYLGHDDIRTTLIYEALCPVDLGKELIKIQFR
jgi:integrase/recombinase XerD